MLFYSIILLYYIVLYGTSVLEIDLQYHLKMVSSEDQYCPLIQNSSYC